jgi:hypothetical protein
MSSQKEIERSVLGRELRNTGLINLVKSSGGGGRRRRSCFGRNVWVSVYLMLSVLSMALIQDRLGIATRIFSLKHCFANFWHSRTTS